MTNEKESKRSSLRFDSATYTLVWHLFRQFMVDNDYTTEDVKNCSIKEFYNWVNSRDEIFPDKPELIEQYGLLEEEFELVTQMFSCPFMTCGQLHTWWPMLVDKEPPLKNKIKAISLVGTVLFADSNKAIQIPVNIPAQTEPFTGGMVGTMWRFALKQMTDIIRKEGIDTLYEKTPPTKYSHD